MIRTLLASVAALIAAAIALAAPPTQAAVTGPATAADPIAAQALTANSHVVAVTPAHTLAPPGANLILNPGAQAGAYSARGWDAVTIPGWQVVSGLPTVVRYGTRRLPGATGRWPAVPGGQLFAGGAGGTARLRQVVELRSASGARMPAGTRFSLAAWLGGDSTSRAALSVTFRSARGRVVGRRAIGPVGGRGPDATMAHRTGAGLLPAGTASASVELTLATSLTNNDGPYAPFAGYDRGVADGLRFSVSAAARAPVLRAPVSHILRYQHVFLFYFENEDYKSVIGNTRLAPFLNGLLPHASLLANSFAEEHPSDGNYLALAGGSAFGIPLTDPLEENPQYTIRAHNIGDLIDSAHESWKVYLQAANGPCDDTVHGFYWDDDAPMTYFADVRGRPSYCAEHLVPLQALQADLSSAASTPNFAWISPDDCADMEGCGIRDGDNFLATELGAIMASPAWRTQRSLAILTFDEDSYDHQHPAQRVATLLLGSAGVRSGYVSHVRYTHYSLLRTIEGALGLGTLTANDRYAQPVNDVFRRGAGSGIATIASPKPAPISSPVPVSSPALINTPATVSPAGAAPRQQTAFVVNSASDSVTPVNLVTRRAGRPIPVGKDPQAIAITPDGAAAYAVNSRSGSITPINTVTRKAGPPIPVGSDPQDIAISPDGRTAYVTDMGANAVTPVNLATGRAGTPIRVGEEPRTIAITPDGRTALVLDWGGAAVTPISLRSGRAGPPIPAGSYPVAISISPGGATAYVAGYGSDAVTPISITSRRARAAIPVGQAPDALAVTPDGTTVLAVGGDSDSVTPISAVTTGAAGLRVRPAIRVGFSPEAVAISASGATAFVVNTISGTLTPISVASGRPGRPIPVASYGYPTAIELAPSGSTAVVVDTYSGQVTLVGTGSRRVLSTITVGSYPVAVAIAR